MDVPLLCFKWEGIGHLRLPVTALALSARGLENWKTDNWQKNWRIYLTLVHFYQFHFSHNVFLLAQLPLVLLTGGAKARISPPQHSTVSLTLETNR